MIEIYQQHEIVVENLDYRISFSVGYDAEKKEYYIPSICVTGNKKDLYYDDPVYIKDLLFEFQMKKDEKVKTLKEDLKEIDIKPSKQILSEIHAILETAYQQEFLDLKY